MQEQMIQDAFVAIAQGSDWSAEKLRLTKALGQKYLVQYMCNKRFSVASSRWQLTVTAGENSYVLFEQFDSSAPSIIADRNGVRFA